MTTQSTIDIATIQRLIESGGLTDTGITQLGFGKWDGKLWLIPESRYDEIPDGTVVVSIMGRTEVFTKGVTDRDQRFGFLAFGFESPLGV